MNDLEFLVLILTLMGFVFGISVIILGLVALNQIKVINRQNRTRLVLSMQDKFYQDADIQDVYHRIKSGEFEFATETLNSGDKKQFDKLLGLLINIGELYFRGLIKDNELEFIVYQLQVIFGSAQFQNFLGQVSPDYSDGMMGKDKLKTLRDLGRKILSKGF